MRTPRRSRGFTLIEMMLSSLILVVAITGFIALVQLVMSSNATAHRRTLGTYGRGALLDRLAVTPRPLVGSLPQPTWFVDECYDGNAQPAGQNLLREATWQCPVREQIALKGRLSEFTSLSASLDGRNGQPLLLGYRLAYRTTVSLDILRVDSSGTEYAMARPVDGIRDQGTYILGLRSLPAAGGILRAAPGGCHSPRAAAPHPSVVQQEAGERDLARLE